MVMCLANVTIWRETEGKDATATIRKEIPPSYKNFLFLFTKAVVPFHAFMRGNGQSVLTLAC